MFMYLLGDGQFLTGPGVRERARAPNRIPAGPRRWPCGWKAVRRRARFSGIAIVRPVAPVSFVLMAVETSSMCPSSWAAILAARS